MKVDAVLREKAKLEEGARAAIPSGEQELNERLSFLRKHDPSGFRVVTTTIDILHKRAVEAGPADDTGNLIEKAAKEILEAGAADLARKRFLKPKPEAAGPPRDEDTRKK